MRVAVALLLCACSVPDRVGVSAQGGVYDYMAAGEPFPTTAPLKNDTGESYGLTLWVEWQLKPQRMVMVQEERAVDWEKPAVPAVTVHTGDTKPGVVGEVADAAVKVAGAVKGDAALTWVLIPFGVLALLAFMWFKYGRKTP